MTSAPEEVIAQLRQANETLEAFAQLIAHELRGPLSAVQGFSDILLEDHAAQLDEEGRDYLQRIATASRRMTDLVGALLTYAELSRPATEHVTTVSWDDIVDRELSDMRGELDAAASLVQVDRPLGKAVGVPAAMAIAVRHLVGNAVKFVNGGRRPEVRIWTDCDGERVRLNVRDNGVGVPPEQQARIFTPFGRLHSNAAFPGSGLGLAMVAAAARQMHGEAGVESDGVSGSRFWISLPRRD